MGDGLNKPAEVTLYKVLPREKGVAITDPVKKEKWIRRLQETATKQSTEFVSYDPDRGIWKFRVEHFSRCCLVACLLAALGPFILHATASLCLHVCLHLQPFIHGFASQRQVLTRSSVLLQ